MQQTENKRLKIIMDGDIGANTIYMRNIGVNLDRDTYTKGRKF